MSTTFGAIHHDEIDGVSTFWLDVPGPFAAVLTFRTGRADEVPAQYGITHLVEHLALAPLGVQDYEHNGGVEPIRTSFQVSGSRSDVIEFLDSATRALADLPTDRILVERAILKREAEEHGRGLGDALRGYRFGGVGLGATAEDEYGIGWLSGDLVRAWANERFGRSNAVLILSGPPDGVRLHLGDGPLHAPPPVATQPAVSLPAFVYWDLPGVALTYVGERVPSANMVANILHRRMRSRLRFDLGAVYDVELDYDPIGANLAHVVLGTEADERETKRVLRTMLEIVDEMAEHGPTTEELANEITGLRRGWELDEGRLGFLYETAFDTLLGRPAPDPEWLVAQRAGVTPERARDIARNIFSQLMAFSAGENPLPDRLSTYVDWSPDEVPGDVIVPAGRHLPGRGPKERLIVGPEGVTLRLSPTERITIRYDAMTASVHEGDTRQLHDQGALSIPFDPVGWRDGAKILERIDAATPPAAFVCSSHSPGGLTDPEGRT